MSKFLFYFGLAMSFVYVLAGIYLIATPFLYKNASINPIMPWLGVVVLIYGIFRMVRAINQLKNYVG